MCFVCIQALFCCFVGPCPRCCSLPPDFGVIGDVAGTHEPRELRLVAPQPFPDLLVILVISCKVSLSLHINLPTFSYMTEVLNSRLLWSPADLCQCIGSHDCCIAEHSVFQHPDFSTWDTYAGQSSAPDMLPLWTAPIRSYWSFSLFRHTWYHIKLDSVWL